MHRLARIGADAGGHEHQPGQHLPAIGRGIGRQELAGLLGEVEQDRVAVEHDHAVIVDRRHLGVRIDLEKLRLELVALAGIDRHQLEGQAGFLEKQRHLGGVRRRVEVKFEHQKSPLFFLPRKIGHGGRRGRQFHAQISAKSASDEFVTGNAPIVPYRSTKPPSTNNSAPVVKVASAAR
jgi:hypothetical protein